MNTLHDEKQFLEKNQARSNRDYYRLDRNYSK